MSETEVPSVYYLESVVCCLNPYLTMRVPIVRMKAGLLYRIKYDRK